MQPGKVTRAGRIPMKQQARCSESVYIQRHQRTIPTTPVHERPLRRAHIGLMGRDRDLAHAVGRTIRSGRLCLTIRHRRALACARNTPHACNSCAHWRKHFAHRLEQCTCSFGRVVCTCLRAVLVGALKQLDAVFRSETSTLRVTRVRSVIRNTKAKD